MAFIIKDQGKKFEPVPAGSHAARCYAVIDLGTQIETWKGEEKSVRKVRLEFELPNLMRNFAKEGEPENMKPMVIGIDFTVSFAENSKLRKFIQNWRGRKMTDQDTKEFDIEIFLNKACLLTVNHTEGSNGNTYANIVMAANLPQGMTCPAAITPKISFQLEAFNQDEYNKLHKWLQEKIAKSPEYKKLGLTGSTTDDDDLWGTDDDGSNEQGPIGDDDGSEVPF